MLRAFRVFVFLRSYVFVCFCCVSVFPYRCPFFAIRSLFCFLLFFCVITFALFFRFPVLLAVVRERLCGICKKEVAQDLRT